MRWSAAKGLGRITARLTCSLADEVLSSVLELFTSREVECSTHLCLIHLFLMKVLCDHDFDLWAHGLCLCHL